MVVNRAMASQPMCVSRLRSMVEPLYSNPQKDPSAVEALNSTKLPPPFNPPEVNRELKEDAPIVATHATVTSKITGHRIRPSMNNMFESGGWELVHEEPPVDLFMEEIPPVQPVDSNHSPTLHNNKQPNGLLQHNNASPDAGSSPSITSSPGSATIRTYTPLTISSEEEGTTSEPDSENLEDSRKLEDSTIGLLRPRKKHAFNAPDLFRNTWKAPKKADNSDALSVSN